MIIRVLYVTVYKFKLNLLKNQYKTMPSSTSFKSLLSIELTDTV